MYNNRELSSLLEQTPLEEKDFRFQRNSYKVFNINTLEDACEILQILLNGSTVIYNDHIAKYVSNSSIIDFNIANGLSINYIFLNDENVYKTFVVL